MEKHILLQSIKENKSTRDISKEHNIGQTTVRYWLKKYGLKTNPLRRIKFYFCKCGESNPDNFYGKQKKQCKKCFNDSRIKVFNETKQKAVDYKGGKCVACSYDKYIGALEFHHINPEEKDPNFQSIKCWS